MHKPLELIMDRQAAIAAHDKIEGELFQNGEPKSDVPAVWSWVQDATNEVKWTAMLIALGKFDEALEVAKACEDDAQRLGPVHYFIERCSNSPEVEIFMQRYMEYREGR